MALIPSIIPSYSIEHNTTLFHIQSAIPSTYMHTHLTQVCVLIDHDQEDAGQVYEHLQVQKAFLVVSLDEQFQKLLNLIPVHSS